MLRFKGNKYERKARDAEKRVKKTHVCDEKIIRDIFQNLVIGP